MTADDTWGLSILPAFTFPAMETDPMRRVLIAGGLSLFAVFISAAIRLPAADKKSDATFDASKLPPPVKRDVDFVRDVRPLFEARCWKCHRASKHESGLSLHCKEAAFAGGDNGKAFEPGKSMRAD